MRAKQILYKVEEEKRTISFSVILICTTALIISGYSLFSLNETNEDLQNFSSEFSKVSSLMNSESFNKSLSALEDVKGDSFGHKMQIIASGMRDLNSVRIQLSHARDDLSKLISLYQWMLLLSILGEVAGVSLLYL